MRIQQASDEDWETVREVITQLYWTEKRGLPEVMEIMEARHNFRAKERQYKARFKEWKLEKNIDSKRMEAIVQIQKRRREHENKETEFRFRGRPLPQEKIDRWQKRRKSGEEVASPHRLAGLSWTRSSSSLG
ncbi:Clr5 domain-containing protein [Chaetomium strumarium]|uniref:Clr5 domain-containing protein n=1 Tax=Chaetomium strumarium TaxID=1170767 RepID=A0AAJ0GRV4_9PEZI|nr:Clr5 domain-containing protein [Chaetomium strumarium]